MTDIKIEVTDFISKEAATVIENGINLFNDQNSGINDRKPLSVVIKDSKTGETLGGILGRSSLGLLFIDLFYLPEALRGNNLGSKLLCHAEEEGRKRGCVSAVLYTINFQAPGFYAKHGWQEFGRVDCTPAGTQRIFMTKKL